MTREQIEKAATESCVIENSIFNPKYVPYYEHGFIDGANWRINAVWHKPNEEPKYDKYFLYENVVHAYHIDGIYPSEDELFVWNDYVKDWGLIRWAYIEDLIPNK